jgi:molybdate transport system substrate-binding protein
MLLRRTVCAGLLCALLSPALAAPAPHNANGITVLAAASLTDALSQIGRTYEAATGRHVALSFAGSMILAKQIEASSGADMFISADEESMDYVDAKGLIAKPTRMDLLGNALVLIAPAGSKTTLAIAPKFPIAAALMGGRLAVANVDTVPAGRYAKASLTALGVWDSVSGRLAQGEDVRATLAYVARGETQLGIVYGTDARAEPKVRVLGAFPDDTHPPILYPVALTKDAKPEAASFLAYLKSEPARAGFAKYGFSIGQGR